MSNIWWIKGNAPDPTTIKVSTGKVKYQVADWWKYSVSDEGAADGTAMFELTTNGQLKFEFFEGKLPDEVNDFTNSVRIYER